MLAPPIHRLDRIGDETPRSSAAILPEGNRPVAVVRSRNPSCSNDNINYKIVHDASNSLKHSVRTGKNSLSMGSKAVEIRSRGWGEAEYGVDEWGGVPMGLITFLDGKSSSLKFAMENLEKQWIVSELGIDAN